MFRKSLIPKSQQRPPCFDIIPKNFEADVVQFYEARQQATPRVVVCMLFVILEVQ